MKRRLVEIVSVLSDGSHINYNIFNKKNVSNIISLGFFVFTLVNDVIAVIQSKSISYGLVVNGNNRCMEIMATRIDGAVPSLKLVRGLIIKKKT